MEAQVIRRHAAASLLGIAENNFMSFNLLGADTELFQPNAESQTPWTKTQGKGSRMQMHRGFCCFASFSPRSVAKVEVNKSHLDS